MTRPLIGINCDVTEHPGGPLLFQLRAPYARAVWKAGGRPVLIPPLGARRPGEALAGLAGLLMTGGDDLDPARYGRGRRHPGEVPLNPLRESFDLALLEEALRLGLPLLAICLGMQEMAVLRGGGLHQSVSAEVPDALPHKAAEGAELPRHPVILAEGSSLRAILGRETEVNSTHRQAVSRPGAGQSVAARAPDGVIEALEAQGPGFAIGVQWHPELMTGDPGQLALFEALVERARARS